MSVHIYVAKYVSDVRRWEPRNIGVVVLDDDGSHAARFIGQTAAGHIDGRSVWHKVNEVEAYRQWVSYWTNCAEQGTDGIAGALSLEPDNYLLMESGEIWSDPQLTSLDALADRYYAQLVEPPSVHTPTPGEQLHDRVEQLLRTTRVSEMRGFQREFVVQSTDSVAVPLRFPYAVQNGSTKVAQRIVLGDEARTQGALFRLEHLPPKVESISFMLGQEVKDHAEAGGLVELLEEHSVVLNVDDPRASSNLLEVVGS